VKCSVTHIFIVSSCITSSSPPSVSSRGNLTYERARERESIVMCLHSVVVVCLSRTAENVLTLNTRGDDDVCWRSGSRECEDARW
jgi:hypothetical protein